MNGSDKVSPPLYGSMTAPIASTALSLRRWVRVIAIALAIVGALVLVGGHVAIFFIAKHVPAARGFLIGIATSYLTMTLALLVQSFLLFRYSNHLEFAARQKRAAPLADGARYENGYWWVTAAMILAMAVGTLIAAVGAGMNIPEHPNMPATASRPTQPEPAEQFQERLRAFNAQPSDSGRVIPFAFLAVGGVVLVAFALRP